MTAQESLNQIVQLAQAVSGDVDALEENYNALVKQNDTLNDNVNSLSAENKALKARIAELEGGKPRTLIGANLGTSKNIDPSTYKGNAEVARVFLTAKQPVTGKKWTDFAQLRQAEEFGIKVIVLSGWDTNAAGIRDFLKTRPTGVTVYYVYAHEPENNAGAVGTDTYKAWSQTWKNNWAKIGPAVREAGCIPTSILMEWTLRAASKRNLADWTPPKGSVDVFAFDAYYDGGDDPKEVFARVAAAAKSVGLPTGIGETGTTVSDPNRVAKTKAARQAAIDNQFVFACYWNNIVGTYDARLKADTAAAWWNK